MGGRVHVERDDRDPRLGWIVFDHPERRNAISVEMWRQIPLAVRELAEDESVRVVLVRGSGEAAFVAGADISEFGEKRSGSAAGNYDVDGTRAFAALATLPKPVIAMVRGYCVGGGVAIALCADLRYAADDAVFAIPAAQLGVGYHAAGIEMLQSLVGPSRAKEIFFTARRYSALEAHAMGLVNEVIPGAELLSRVRDTARRIADNAPLTVASVKRIVSELAQPREQRDDAAIDASIAACFASEDYREGVAAFLAKRKPRFSGR
jgi:enoyl-CoA hydratase/carnithine racemase